MIPGIVAARRSTGGGGSGYRYYRILVTANNGHAYFLVICEVEFRATHGGADLTSPAAAVTAATASDDARAGGLIWQDSAISAFDNNLVYGGTKATRAQWVSNSTPPRVWSPKWLRYDFGTPTAVTQMALIASHTTEVNPSTAAPKDFKVQGSNDNVVWTDLVAPSSQTNWTPAEQRLFSW